MKTNILLIQLIRKFKEEDYIYTNIFINYLSVIILSIPEII